MTTYTERLRTLLQDLEAGHWAPSLAEVEAAKNLTQLPRLTPITVREALAPARLTRSRLVVALEGVASVLSLPPIHEEESDRQALLDQAVETARAVASRLPQ